MAGMRSSFQETGSLLDITHIDLSWMETELRGRDIRHTCGLPYKMKWLDKGDGRIWRLAPTTDAYEAVLSATCEMCVRGGVFAVQPLRQSYLVHTSSSPLNVPQQVTYKTVRADTATAYNYCRFTVSGMSVARARDSHQLIWHEVQRGWREFVKHLEDVQDGTFVPPPNVSHEEWHQTEFAGLAEELTLLLAQGPRDFLPVHLLDAGERMGFKSESGWSLPDDHPLAGAA